MNHQKKKKSYFFRRAQDFTPGHPTWSETRLHPSPQPQWWQQVATPPPSARGRAAPRPHRTRATAQLSPGGTPLGGGRSRSRGTASLQLPGKEPKNCDEGDSPQLHHSILFFRGGGTGPAPSARPSPAAAQGRAKQLGLRIPPVVPWGPRCCGGRAAISRPRGQKEALSSPRPPSPRPGERSLTQAKSTDSMGPAAPRPSRRAAGRGGRGGAGAGSGGAPPHPEPPRPGGMWGAWPLARGGFAWRVPCQGREGRGEPFDPLKALRSVWGPAGADNCRPDGSPQLRSTGRL